MTEDLVRTSNLTKRYGSTLAVDGVDLTVRRGEVYGFLGPNGAGKTTTLRMLLGLIRPTSGTARVLDAAPGAARGLAGVGMLVESPAFYPYLSGVDNLRVLARYAGVSADRVRPALDAVELTSRGGDRFGTYSLGMKQRLGVAAALLKDPELLILDEPTNGLDPAGMADMRMLVRRIGSGGRTVLLSSHLLGEVQQICDRVGIISGGRILREGTVAEVRGGGALLVTADPPDRAREVLSGLLGPQQVATDGAVLRVQGGPDDAPRITRALVGADVDVRELRWVEPSLEDIFFELTGDRGQLASVAGEGA